MRPTREIAASKLAVRHRGQVLAVGLERLDVRRGPPVQPRRPRTPGSRGRCPSPARARTVRPAGRPTSVCPPAPAATSSTFAPLVRSASSSIRSVASPSQSSIVGPHSCHARGGLLPLRAGGALEGDRVEGRWSWRPPAVGAVDRVSSQRRRRAHRRASAGSGPGRDSFWTVEAEEPDTEVVKDYVQYCPVALASSVLAERWTPLIVRELVLGGRRFNDIDRGLPGISRSLLKQRLDHLERKGVVTRVELAHGRGPRVPADPGRAGPGAGHHGAWASGRSGGCSASPSRARSTPSR